MVRIGFVGCGRVAQTLAAAFDKAGMVVGSASSRNASRRDAFAARLPAVRTTDDAQQVVDDSTLVFLTVADDAIAPVCAALAWRADQAVVHASGATELAALATARAAGAAVGGFHPMQMFANPEVALAGLPGCTVGIEADEPLLATLRAMAEAIGCVPFTLPAGVRPLYHASAYYVGPFLIALLKEGSRLWERFGADESRALAAMLPLLSGTVDAVRDAGLARGMGGCVARGDLGTIRTHLAALDAMDAGVASLYRTLAARNVPLGIARGTLDVDRAKAIEALLAQPSVATTGA